jgi:hypothetical protein
MCFPLELRRMIYHYMCTSDLIIIKDGKNFRRKSPIPMALGVNHEILNEALGHYKSHDGDHGMRIYTTSDAVRLEWDTVSGFYSALATVPLLEQLEPKVGHNNLPVVFCCFPIGMILRGMRFPRTAYFLYPNMITALLLELNVKGSSAFCLGVRWISKCHAQ